MILCLALAGPTAAQPPAIGTNKLEIGVVFKTVAMGTFPQDCDEKSAASLGLPFVVRDENRSYKGVSFVIRTTRIQSIDEVCLSTDLSDLIGKIPAIVATKPMPTNNCATYAHGNPVVVVYNSALASLPGTNSLVFTMNGKMTPWACFPGPRLPRSQWVRQKGKVPYLRVWTEPGPDIKTVGIVKPFDEKLWFELKGSSSSVEAFKAADSLPQFTGLVPAINMSELITGALNEARPTFPDPQIPLVNVTGRRYWDNRSQIWGTI
jgi:hypothetical protein